MLREPNPPEPPPLIDALAVWGWAVEHGGIPLAYAADVLADHACYVEPAHTGVEDATVEERCAWAIEDLTDWENLVVRMDWPGDDAADEERWDQPADWRLREFLLRRAHLKESRDTTDQLLLRHCLEQIAECELADQHDTTHRTEGN